MSAFRESGRQPALSSQRYLGLELSGAKNPKTALAAIEFYPKERKIFLLDIYERISPHDEQSGDEALLEVLGEIQADVTAMGANVPLTLPPCIGCERKTCPLPSECTVPSVRWMRELVKKTGRQPRDEAIPRIRDFTPYTQRPVELWLRYSILPNLPSESRFEIDEALGGTKAPLTARMHFLQRHLNGLPVVEVSPKLTVAALSRELGLSRFVSRSYRHLEEGAQARAEIIESLARARGVFVYERDVRKLSMSLAAFDAFLCAYTALLSTTEGCDTIPKGFPIASGWIHSPEVHRTRGR